MSSWREPKSVQLDRATIGETFLTLATWDTGYGPSPEIGVRQNGGFTLVQWRRMPHAKAWEIAKRMAAKGRDARDIQRVLDRLTR